MKFQVGDIVLFWGECAVVETIVRLQDGPKVKIGLGGHSYRFNCEWPLGMWPPDRWLDHAMLVAHQVPWAFDRNLGGWVTDAPTPQ